MAKSVHPSQCWECNAYCGSLISKRDGKILKIGPNPDHPGSKGAFCIKGIRAVREWTDNQNRLLFPMRRVGARGSGEWERISWDAALDAALAAFEERWAKRLAPFEHAEVAVAAAEAADMGAHSATVQGMRSMLDSTQYTGTVTGREAE